MACAEPLLGAEELKEEILSRVSHELRTPLTIMGLSMEAMRASEAPTAKDWDRFERSLKRLQGSVEDLLLLSRLRAGLEPARRPCDPWRLVQGAWASYAGELTTKRLRGAVSVSGPQRALLLDERLVFKAVGNLVSNAVRFTPVGGSVRVDCQFEGGGVIVSVGDSGEALPRADEDRAFAGFYQADPLLTRREGGLGIGLAQARLIAEAHGGGLSLKRPSSGGSLFVLQLPER